MEKNHKKKMKWFEYHCWESSASSDAEVWYRSHQRIEVLKRGEDDHDQFPDEPKVYKVRFEDGFEYDVFDDEIMDSPNQFYRPDPTKEKPLINLIYISLNEILCNLMNIVTNISLIRQPYIVHPVYIVWSSQQ